MTLKKLNFSSIVKRYERHATFYYNDQEYICIRAIGFTQEAVDNYVDELKVNFEVDESSTTESFVHTGYITNDTTNQSPDPRLQNPQEILEIYIDFFKLEKMSLSRLIRFTIDPSINKNYLHEYKFANGRKASVEIKAYQGAIAAQLFQGDRSVNSKVVDVIASTATPSKATLEKLVSSNESTQFTLKVIGNMDRSRYTLDGHITMY